VNHRARNVRHSKLVINMKTARALGTRIRESVTVRADRVIECTP
jgi:ABC-type uncharacterized transport system substrate-binding protein